MRILSILRIYSTRKRLVSIVLCCLLAVFSSGIARAEENLAVDTDSESATAILITNEDIELQDAVGRCTARIQDGIVESFRDDIYQMMHVDVDASRNPWVTVFLPADLHNIYRLHPDTSVYEVNITHVQQSATVETNASHTVCMVNDEKRTDYVIIKGDEPGCVYTIQLETMLEDLPKEAVLQGTTTDEPIFFGWIAGVQVISGVNVSSATLTIDGETIALNPSQTAREETVLITYRGIHLVVNGKTVNPQNVHGEPTEPFILDGSTYLPARAIAQALGMDVSWDADTHTVVLTSGAALDFTEGSPSETFDTHQVSIYYRDIQIVLDGKPVSPTDASGNPAEPFILDGTVYLPVRAVASALGCAVDWDQDTNTVLLYSHEQ